MPVDPFERMRTLRRDGYRCQARSSDGIPCETPASEVGGIELTALCSWHAARFTATGKLTDRRPKVS